MSDKTLTARARDKAVRVLRAAFDRFPELQQVSKNEETWRLLVEDIAEEIDAAEEPIQ